MLPQAPAGREPECRSEYGTRDMPALRSTFRSPPIPPVLVFATTIIVGGPRITRAPHGKGEKPMAVSASAQAQPASAQTIEAYVGEQLDNARMGPVHWRVLALVAGGYFFDVI